MLRTHTLGMPRVGAQRELTFALEKYWSGQIDGEVLEHIAADLRKRQWQAQREAGLDWVTVGDFALYDHVANHIQMLGCEPARLGLSASSTALERYFAMAGTAASTHDHDADCGCSAQHTGQAQPGLATRQWFDTHYHYLVPEFSEATEFRLRSERLFAEVEQAVVAGHRVKVVLLGPLSFLWLGQEKQAGFERLSLLDKLLPVYLQILARLRAQGVDWVQMDEPILGLELPQAWRNAYERCYWQLARSGVRLLLATYFSPLQENLRLACQLPVHGLHVDAVTAPQELVGVADWLPHHKVLSVGVVDGRNIWRTDLDVALGLLQALLEKFRGEVWLAPSCSLLHVPYSLGGETQLEPQLRSWLAFAVEKLGELRLLKALLAEQPASATLQAQHQQCRAALDARRSSPRVHNPAVSQRLAQSDPQADQRHAPHAQRQPLQRQRFALPLLPTTTIGSLPQTLALHQARAAFKRGELGANEFQHTMQRVIAQSLRQQEALGLDVLVHGEAERSDMVAYFAEHLQGFAFTANGWVQSCGAHCIKPPLLYGDVARPAAMTVEWARYAQSQTTRPVKGMLTGPVTLLQWSFVRDDQPRSRTAQQIAWALRDEVCDLEQAGIGMVQIDEPALREGLPPRRSGWDAYLAWASRAFRISASGVRDETQIHTHVCGGELEDILPQMAALDADVLTIESRRSGLNLRTALGEWTYPNQIGPGVYDSHSPHVPSQAEVIGLLRQALQVVPQQRLWINPDCGLKGRTWAQSEPALANLVAAAKVLRQELCEPA